jgi:tetratricopeptide (TPR) repeat protein
MRAAVVLVSFTRIAFAQDGGARGDAHAHFKEAQLQYQLGSYDKALEEYRAAYDLLAHPDLLFNIGQCHRQLGDCERAIFFYQEYLSRSKAPPNRALVEELVAECKKVLASAPPPPPAPPPILPPPVESQPPPPPIMAPIAPPPAVEETAIYEEWWFWTIIAGVAVAGAAVTAALVVPSKEEPIAPGTLGSIDWR